MKIHQPSVLIVQRLVGHPVVIGELNFVVIDPLSPVKNSIAASLLPVIIERIFMFGHPPDGELRHLMGLDHFFFYAEPGVVGKLAGMLQVPLIEHLQVTGQSRVEGTQPIPYVLIPVPVVSRLLCHFSPKIIKRFFYSMSACRTCSRDHIPCAACTYSQFHTPFDQEAASGRVQSVHQSSHHASPPCVAELS